MKAATRVRCMALVLVCALTLISSGCMVLERDSFFSPDAVEECDFTTTWSFGELSPWYGCPPNNITLLLADVQVSIGVNYSYYEFSWFGPLCFPVIPDVFTREESREIGSFRMGVTIQPQKDIEVDLREWVTLRIPGEQDDIKFTDIEYYPVRPMYPTLSTEEPVYIASGKTACFSFTFTLPQPMELSGFTVLLNGIYINGVLLDPVYVDFQMKKGWFFATAP